MFMGLHLWRWTKRHRQLRLTWVIVVITSSTFVSEASPTRMAQARTLHTCLALDDISLNLEVIVFCGDGPILSLLDVQP